VRHWVYAGLLVACLLGTLPLEIWLGTRVYARPRRLLLSLAPVVALFTVWDVYAISRHQWRYDGRQITGLRLGDLPIEELAFFVVVPVCSLLTFEAVRAVRGWPAGDE